MRGAIRRLLPIAAFFAVVGVASAAIGWFTTSPPRPTSFSYQTVTVTKQVLVTPWWFSVLDGLLVGLVLVLIWMGLTYMPRGIQ